MFQSFNASVPLPVHASICFVDIWFHFCTSAYRCPYIYAFSAYVLWILAYFCASVLDRPYMGFVVHLLIFVQVFLIVHTRAFSTRAPWYTCLFSYKCLLLSIHMFSVHVLFGHYTCFLVQVLIVVHTRFQYTCFSDTKLTFWYKYLSSSIHMLLVHVLFGHYTCFLVQVLMVIHTHAFSTHAFWTLYLLFGTSAYCPP